MPKDLEKAAPEDAVSLPKEDWERMTQALSHQIRGSLSLQFSVVQNLLRAESELPADFREALTLVRQSSYRVLRTQTLLSNYFHLLAGEEVFSFHRLNIRSVLQELGRAVEVFSLNLHTPLELTLPEEFLYVRADPSKLEFCLLTLLLNAFKYTRPGNVVRLDASLEGDTVRIQVSDRGRGMSGGVLARACDPFFSYNPDSPYPQSMGLGLTLCRHYAEQFGGGLTLDSREGEGTTAALLLPLAKFGDGEPVTASDSAVDYLSNLFSPVFVAFSDICPIP